MRAWRCSDADTAKLFCDFVMQGVLMGKTITYTIEPEKRSVSQNDMQHAIYAEVSGQKEDESPLQIKRQCKLMQGVPILRAEDGDFRVFYDTHIKPNLSYEEKLVAMDIIPVTSRMTKTQGSAYIDAILDYWTGQGFRLADPRMEK